MFDIVFLCFQMSPVMTSRLFPIMLKSTPICISIRWVARFVIWVLFFFYCSLHVRYWQQHNIMEIPIECINIFFTWERQTEPDMTAGQMDVLHMIKYLWRNVQKKHTHPRIFNNFSILSISYFLMQEEIQERPQITSMISSLANYSNTIPAAPEGADGDAKAPAPSARMGKLFSFNNVQWSWMSI